MTKTTQFSASPGKVGFENNGPIPENGGGGAGGRGKAIQSASYLLCFSGSFLTAFSSITTFLGSSFASAFGTAGLVGVIANGEETGICAVPILHTRPDSVPPNMAPTTAPIRI